MKEDKALNELAEKGYCFESDLPKEIYDKTLPMFTKEDFVDETDEIKMINPFLYNFKNNKSIIYSIEEFGIVYKKRKIYFGSFIRNEQIKKQEKIRIIRKYFRLRKNEFKKKHRSVKKQINKTNSKEINTKISLKVKIYLVIMLIFNIAIQSLLTGKISNENSILVKLLENFNKIINITAITIAINISFLSIVFGLLYIKSFRISVKNYNKNYKNNLNTSNKIIDCIYKTFKKEYRTTKRYYINNVKKQLHFYTTLGLNGLWNMEYTYDDILNSKALIENENININKLCKMNKIIINIIIYLITLSNAFLFGILMYVLIKSISNSI